MKLKATVMDEAAMHRSLMRIAHEIEERNEGKDVYLVGIRRRGIPLARIIADNIEKVYGKRPEIGELDIVLYRDDLSKKQDIATVTDTNIPFDINGKRIIIVDDVLYTGRTARAAIEAIFSEGRPEAIQFAVLIDRGHRELPIRADFVGKNIPTSQKELIAVNVPEFDGKFSVELFEKEN